MLGGVRAGREPLKAEAVPLVARHVLAPAGGVVVAAAPLGEHVVVNEHAEAGLAEPLHTVRPRGAVGRSILAAG